MFWIFILPGFFNIYICIIWGWNPSPNMNQLIYFSYSSSCVYAYSYSLLVVPGPDPGPNSSVNTDCCSLVWILTLACYMSLCSLSRHVGTYKVLDYGKLDSWFSDCSAVYFRKIFYLNSNLVKRRCVRLCTSDKEQMIQFDTIPQSQHLIDLISEPITFFPKSCYAWLTSVMPSFSWCFPLCALECRFSSFI